MLMAVAGFRTTMMELANVATMGEVLVQRVNGAKHKLVALFMMLPCLMLLLPFMRLISLVCLARPRTSRLLWSGAFGCAASSIAEHLGVGSNMLRMSVSIRKRRWKQWHFCGFVAPGRPGNPLRESTQMRCRFRSARRSCALAERVPFPRSSRQARVASSNADARTEARGMAADLFAGCMVVHPHSALCAEIASPARLLWRWSTKTAAPCTARLMTMSRVTSTGRCGRSGRSSRGRIGAVLKCVNDVGGGPAR